MRQPQFFTSGVQPRARQPSPMVRAFHFALTAFFLLWAINLRVLLKMENITPIMTSCLLVVGAIFLAGHRPSWGGIFLLTLMALITLAMAAGVDFPGFSIDRYGRSLLSLIAPWIFLCAIPTREDRDVTLLLFSWLPILVCSVGIIYSLLGMHEIWHIDFLGARRLQGSGIPSGLGAVAYISSFAAMLGWSIKRTWKFALLLAANLVILLLTAARAPFILAIPLLGVTYLTLYRHSLTSLVATVLLGPVMLAIGAIFLSGPLMHRIESDSLSGREMIWASLHDVLKAYPTFGIGLGHQILVMPEEVTRRAQTIAAHNEYLRIAVECGYVGAALIFACLTGLCLLVWSSRRVRFHPVFLAASAAFFLYALTDNVLSSPMGPFVIVLASFAFPETGLASSKRKPMWRRRTSSGQAPLEAGHA